jgi:hypothetical protein
VLNLAGHEGVVAGDPVAGVGGDEGAGDVATLGLTGVGAEPAIKAGLAAFEVGDVVVAGVERLDRPELAHAGRIDWCSARRRRPASKRSG